MAVALKAGYLGLKDDSGRRKLSSSSSNDGKLATLLLTVEEIAKIYAGVMLAMTKSGPEF